MLRWHMVIRPDMLTDEYATDELGNPRFLITTNEEGYSILYHAAHEDSGNVNMQRIAWHEVWEFDSLEQARNEAELRFQQGRIHWQVGDNDV